jgi:hypothetical protein
VRSGNITIVIEVFQIFPTTWGDFTIFFEPFRTIFAQLPHFKSPLRSPGKRPQLGAAVPRHAAVARGKISGDPVVFLVRSKWLELFPQFQ